MTGFQQLNTEEKLIRIESSKELKQILVLTNRKLYKYEFVQPGICTLGESFDFNLDTPVFVDVKYHSSKVLLLEATRGLYTITQQGLLEPFPMAATRDLRYTLMQVFNNTVEIIVWYDHRNYVVELILRG